MRFLTSAPDLVFTHVHVASNVHFKVQHSLNPSGNLRPHPTQPSAPDFLPLSPLLLPPLHVPLNPAPIGGTGTLHAFPMEQDWMKKVNGRWQRPRWVLRKCLCTSFIPPHRPQKPPPLGKPALIMATKQPPTPPLPSVHPPKLPQRPVSQPRSSTGSVASQASIPRRLQRKLPGPHTHTLRKQLLPLAHKHAARASTTAHPTLRRYRRHPAACAELVGPSQESLRDDSSPVHEDAKYSHEYFF